MLAVLWSYVLRVSDVPAEQLGRVLATEVDAVAEATLMSTAERIEKAAFLKLLERQLTARFGALPADVAQRLRTASSAEIERWAEAILFAKTLDDVFGRD